MKTNIRWVLHIIPMRGCIYATKQVWGRNQCLLQDFYDKLLLLQSLCDVWMMMMMMMGQK